MPSPPSQRLQRARLAAGYSNPTDAARAMGATVSTYLGHENGSRGLGRAAARYAKFYGVSLDWLLEGKGPGPAPTQIEQPPTAPLSAGSLESALDAALREAIEKVLGKVIETLSEAAHAWIEQRLGSDAIRRDRASPEGLPLPSGAQSRGTTKRVN